VRAPLPGPCSTAAELSGRHVVDVVVRLPKTLGPSATVAEARAAFADDHVHMLLLTDGGRLLGTLVSGDLPYAGADDLRAVAYATLEGRTLPPHLRAEDARQLLLASGQRRRAVVDDSGRLLGLLCLKRRLSGFCSDDDVAARSTERVGGCVPIQPSGA
jgi:CBS domain-containing protein